MKSSNNKHPEVKIASSEPGLDALANTVTTEADKNKKVSIKKINDIQIEHRDFVLSDQEAKAVSPEDKSVCGEEDPGANLESLVDEQPKS